MALPHSGIPAADPAPQDAEVADLIAETLTVTGASALAAVTATSIAAPHSTLTGVTADQHHAQSHAHNGADGSGTVAHSATTGQTANDHHNQAHAVDGADHTASGLTAGHVLRATGATTFAFGALADADVPATIARDSEVTTAVSDHAALADPHPGYQKESEKAAASGYASLDGAAKVPIAQVPTGTTSSTVSLGDHGHTPQAGSALRTAGDYSTASTTFVDVDATNLALTITTGERRVLIGATVVGFVSSTTANLALDVTVDGARIGGTLGVVTMSQISGGSDVHNLSFTWLTDPLTAASHTFKLQYRVSAGTGTLFASGTIPLRFYVIEQGA